MLIILLFIATVFLAYANGANDNFKGVATLFGSRTTNYRVALGWATVTTLAGSLFSVALAHELIVAFSGKGLVAPLAARDPVFLVSVALGAALTVMVAALTGFPISTTHSLVGALVGAGFMAVGSAVNFTALGSGFVFPLLFSPMIAVALTALLYSIFSYLRRRIGITKEDCICIGEPLGEVALVGDAAQLRSATDIPFEANLAKEEICTERYRGSVFGIGVEKILDALHFLSAGWVSFARGLNDTPKIMGVLLVAGLLDVQISMLLLALAMAAGGLLHARKVAMVMSRDITPLNHGQGFTANFVTALLVTIASILGMPVSTTHVSVSSLFGIGVVNRQADYSVIKKISASWLLTLPLASAIAALTYWALTAASSFSL